MELSIPFSLFSSEVTPQDTALISIPNTAYCAHHCFILCCCRRFFPRCFSHCCLYPSSLVTQRDMALVSIPNTAYCAHHCCILCCCPCLCPPTSLSTSLFTWQVIIILVVVTFCEVIYTLTLTLPKSTCTQGRSRSFHWDQDTNCQHIDKGVPSEYILLTLAGHVWTVTHDDLIILAIQVRRSKPSSVDITNGLSFAREDIEAYKIRIPTSMTLLLNIHMTSPMSSHFQPNVSGEYSNEEFSHPTALNYCQRPPLFSTEMEIASLQIQTRFLVPLSAHFKSPVRDFRPVSLLRFHMTQYYKIARCFSKKILVDLELDCTPKFECDGAWIANATISSVSWAPHEP